jgi:chromate reductase
MIEIIIGTSRPGANSRKAGNIVFNMYKELGVEIGLIDLKDIPITAFTGEAINERPKAIQQYSDRILKADGVHIVTPEYNAGVPGVFKSFIDLLPIPEATANKWFAVTTISAGNFGGIRALQWLQTFLLYKEAFVFNKSVMLSNADSLFDTSDQFVNEKDAARVKKQVSGFAEFVKKLKG